MSVQIEVIAYEAYRGSERPRTLILRGASVEVIEIMEQWIEEGMQDRRQRRFFRLRGSDGNDHTVFHDLASQEWFLQ